MLRDYTDVKDSLGARDYAIFVLRRWKGRGGRGAIDIYMEGQEILVLLLEN